MKKLLLTALATIGAAVGIWSGSARTASAIPGQPVDEAKAWMQAHPTLRALPNERLSLRRSDTPARRYTFHGSIFGPAGGSGQTLLERGLDSGLMPGQMSGPIVVRSEKFTLVDLINGVSVSKLEDALRMLYGAQVFADYRRAESVLVYSPGRTEDRGTARAPRAQITEGALYAYIIEVTPDVDGTIHTGTVTVMLKEDIPPLRAALEVKEIERQEFIEGQSDRDIERLQRGVLRP